LGKARDETHRSQKTEAKTKVKKKRGGGGGRTIKKPNRKKAVKN
jgi:hypothetical protein